MDNDDLYQALAESSHDIIFVIDKQGYVRYVNSVAAKFLGALPEKIKGRHLKDLFAPDAYEMQSRALQRVFESGEPFCVEEDKSFAERKIWLETRLIPIRGKNNEIAHVMGVTRDITNLKHSQEELRETTDRLDAILEASPSAIVTLDSAGTVTHWNKAAEHIFGWSSEEVIGKPYPMVPEDKQEEFRALLERSMRGESFIGVEVRRRKKDGSPVDINIAVAPLHNRFGEIYGTVAVINDITERKQTEEALRESKDQFRKVVENSPLSMALVSPDGVIEYINLKAIETFGYMPEDIPNMDRWWVQAYPDKTYRDEVIAQWMGLVAEALTYNHEIEQREYRVTCKDGSVKVMAIFGVWIADKVLVIFDDITERKKAEMELEKYRTQLEKLVERRTKELSLLNDQLRQSQKLEAVGILAGGIAHEFSNILATMKGSMYLIQKKLPEGSPVMEYAELVFSSINKASILSQDLLTFSRKQKISLRPVHFNEIVGNVGRMLIQLIGEDIELAMTLSDKNPTVMADMNQIEQVLVNLATNARDAMPDGGRLTIGTDVIRMDEDFKKQHGYGVPGEYVVLTISDNGTGIEEAIKGKIFEPFFTTKAVGKGSGLGLAVTYGIVKKHNGFIDVESVPGEGTTFRIYFPTVQEEVVRPTGRDKQLAIGGSETILLAEDDEDARVTMSEMVRMIGYTVLEARDGEEAVRVFLKNKDKIQLVFLDVRMPKKNGRVVYEEIKRMHPQTKFLFISGYTADIMDSLGSSEGGINFISKAASPGEILRKIREVLDQ